ncbi:unnamed protein product [Rotaria magnacalcarata]|uniref:Uncharacterized protein n=1 Tax=Rotaria magnacalcarata TaxID=392030 RepID=A0A816W9F1_9BILA|nr:unnamed protein product [Rotaria magnacalcarata]CAF1632884.1 unnamed protein product [Rotaria magnacalcarata]CAF2130547.1 unnamed protein product [Rotaria magnacalcarata]CAF3774825.1 unnamed protein product [Rotaria magnacalcarata]CAF3800082.1 unnamed protein product [Rotaria magnacalcarata]
MFLYVDTCVQLIKVNYNSLIILLYCISLILLLIKFCQQRQIEFIIEIFKRKSSRSIKILSEFQLWKPYKLFSIDETTSTIPPEELIIEAQRTNRFVIFYFDENNGDTQYIPIELKQGTLDIIMNNEFLMGYNIMLTELVTVTNETSNTENIQVYIEINDIN